MPAGVNLHELSVQTLEINTFNSVCYNFSYGDLSKGYRNMNDHYSDYLRKSVPVKDLVFDKVQEGDKELVKSVKKEHIRTNAGFLVLLTIGFVACVSFFIGFITTPSDSIFFQILSLAIAGGGAFVTGDLIYSILGNVKGIRKGVVLTASRMQEVKDTRNATYQYVFDIYMEDRDETLMSYSVGQEVFGEVQPGDGVIIVKVGRKIKVMNDPQRKGIMDVSKIKSGI